MACSLSVTGLPNGCTADQLSQLFDAHATVLDASVSPYGGRGVVRVASATSADKVLGKELELQGNKVCVKGINSSKLARPLLAEDPTKTPNTPLDTCVVRGSCTKNALGAVATYAKAKATVMVIWDRHCPKEQDSAIVKTLRKQEYTGNEDEQADRNVCVKVMGKFGKASSKCALIHFVSGQLMSASPTLDKPLWHADELIRMQADSHIQTVQACQAGALYAKWLHSFKASLFIVIPDTVEAYSMDLGTCNIGVHRVVASDMLRTDDAGFVIGLQLAEGDFKKNTESLCKAVNDISSMSQQAQSSLSGRTVSLE